MVRKTIDISNITENVNMIILNDTRNVRIAGESVIRAVVSSLEPYKDMDYERSLPNTSVLFAKEKVSLIEGNRRINKWYRKKF